MGLERLNLSRNLIWGTIPDQISQFKALKLLDFSRNNLEGKVPEGIGALNSLQVLNLGSNLLSSIPPLVFGNFSELIVLDLSQNSFLVSEIPNDIGKLGKIEQLLLQSSGFYGSIPKSLVDLVSLVDLDLSQNNLTGVIPMNLGHSLTNLVSFDVSDNKLYGSFPDGICKSKGLISYSLHSNFLNGSIPSTYFNECLSIEKFQVQNNQFSGDFPYEIWSLHKIKVIRAENNRFTGQVPENISKAAQLEQVQIDNNSFTGKIPQGLGMVRSLYRFSASQNNFYGEIPLNFCDSPVMSILNFSYNTLSGQIPELGKCRKLVSLSLAANNFIGEIPLSLAQLPVLTYLDLSNNKLIGPIPLELKNLKLALFNVSFNQLSGEVPLYLISDIPASFLQGNPNLCGPGLPNSCSNIKKNQKMIGISKFTYILISIGLLFTIVMVIIGYVYVKRSLREKRQMGTCNSVFFYPLRLSENDIIMACDEKTAIGRGTFGTFHIVSLPSGELIAVKKIENLGAQSLKELKAEIKTLAKIRHKNIAKILGFCYSEESIYLIYEHLPKGSLGDLICKMCFEMPWSSRLRVAIGVAQGLAYLHKDYAPQILHRNIKSKNILFDENFEPKLTDFALDRILGETTFQSSLASESALSCYIAPEYKYRKKGTEQMDTYSFGVILLELITGKQAEQIGTDDSLDVVTWVRRKVHISDGATQVLDPNISNSSSQGEILRVLDVALRCTAVAPEKRPPMVEVLKLLLCLGSETRVQNVEFSVYQP